MAWYSMLAGLGGLAIELGLGFGIAFLFLQNFQTSAGSNTAGNAIGNVIAAFNAPIGNYLGLIITIIFLLVAYGIYKANQRREG